MLALHLSLFSTPFPLLFCSISTSYDTDTMAMQGAPTNYDELEKLLADDFKIKVAGIDVDGILRGKVMHKDKFLSIAKSRSRAFGFCRYVDHAARIALFQPYRIEIWLISKWV